MPKVKSSRSHLSSASAKRIPTIQLKPGMFLVGVYQSWWNSPFFRHNRLLTQKDIDQLIQARIQEVMIDPSRGLDSSEPEHPEESLSHDDAQSPIATGEEPSHGPSIVQEEGKNQANGRGSTESEQQSSREAACQIRDDTIKAVESVFEGVKTGTAIDHPALQKTVTKLLDQVFSQGEQLAEAVIIQNLKQFDKALYGHVVDVAVLSLLVGIRLEMNEELLTHLAMGALLHDVGHVRLPKNLLRRKQNLIGDEQALFERHPQLGIAILESCPTLSEESRRIVLEHHERQDGSGYPHRLRQTAISNLSDIVSLIDRFDGLVSFGGAPTALPSALAIRCLYQEAKAEKFCPTPVEALIKCLGVYPIGSLVSLTTGERAIVLKANPQEKLKPTVKIITDTAGKAYSIPIVLDLCASGSSSPERAISSVLNPDQCKVNVVKYLEEANV